MPAKRYELARCIISVDGYVMSGFGVQGGVEIQFAESAMVETGADGDNAVSFHQPHAAPCKITLMASSVANKHLFAVWQAQLEEDTLAERPFTLSDPGNGDEVNAKAFVVLKTPDMVKNKQAGERVWECQIFDFTRRFAPSITG